MPTLATVVEEIRDMLGESVRDGAWTDKMLRRWINEGARDLARSTRHFKGNALIDTIAGTGTYAVGADIIAIEHVFYEDSGGRTTELMPRHIENWGQVTTPDVARGGRPLYYATQGFQPSLQLMLYPIPDVTDETIKLVTARLPDEVALTGADDNSDLEIPGAWYDALVDYAEFKALRRDRDARWKEAYDLYTEKRDGLINNVDYTTANREVVADPNVGYLPAWLVDPDYY